MYTIRLFAGLAERAGVHHIQVVLDDETTIVQALRTAIVEQYPALSTQLHQALVAVNQAYAREDTVVRPTDEIALIPPVGGGAPPTRSIRLSSKPLDVQEAYVTLEDKRNGGTVLFVGTVREWTGDKQTSHLTYEAYETMALQQMERIADDVEAAYPGVCTLQWHRTGHLHPAEVAVICAAASPHRDAAFRAARDLIERLKKEVPIWKKEFYTSGDTVWQANPE